MIEVISVSLVIISRRMTFSFYWITTAVKGKKPKYEENYSKLKRKICHLSPRARRARGLKWHIFL